MDLVPTTRRLVAVALAAALVVGVAPGVVAGADDEVDQVLKELHKTKDRIRARSHKLRLLQRDLNRLATSISLNESQIDEAGERMEVLGGEIDVLEEENLVLEARLGDRNREAYILGPGAPFLYLLTATSAEDAASRMSILTEMNRRDAELAAAVHQNTQRLGRARVEMVRLQRTRQLSIQQLELDKAELRERFADVRKLYASLQIVKEEILYRLSKIRPFAVCPVQGPVAIANDFGIWVQRSKERGGDHVHQGNDMMTPMGTPIVAPFDGIAVAAPNKLGGLAVKVFGEYGYVYNAHNSRYGKLGPVQTGDVIAYAGATGNTGASHDHFEWHPGNGPAVDPYPFLMKVC
jgi:murein DD-endopeptidase MepM/ murein hydrolase activator NlpD